MDNEVKLRERAITGGERRFVDEIVADYDEPVFMRWIAKRKRNKIQPRLIVVTRFRVFSVKRNTATGRKEVRRNGHLHDLQKIKSDPKKNAGRESRVVLAWKDFKIDISQTADGDADVVDHLISSILQSLAECTHNFPAPMLPTLAIAPTDRLKTLQPAAHEPGTASDFVVAYLAACNRLGVEPSDGLIQFVCDTAAEAGRDLVLDSAPGVELSSEISFNLRSVTDAMRYNSYFSGLVLRGVPERRDALSCLGDCLATNRVIKLVQFTELSNIEGFARLGEALKANSSIALRHLDLSGNRLGDKGAGQLAVGIETLASGLRILALKNCGIGGKGMGLIARSLISNPKISGTLVELGLGHNPLGHAGSKSLASFLQATSSAKDSAVALKCLDLSSTQLDGFAIMAAIKSSRPLSNGLEFIDLSGNKCDQNACAGIAYVLEHSKSLQYMGLADCHLNGDSVFVFITAASTNKSLDNIELDLAHNNLGSAGAVRTAQALSSAEHIAAVSLNDNAFGSVGLAAIFRALQSNKDISCVDVSRNVVGDKKKQSDWGNFAKSFEDMLASTQCALDTLVLSGNAKFHIRQLGELLPALGMNKSLKTLDITGNFMGDKGIVKLAMALSKNTALQFLEWDGNLSNVSGWQSMASCLKQNKTLLQAPTPMRDIRQAFLHVKERDRLRLREQVVKVMDQLTSSLAQNRGDEAPPSFAGALATRSTFRKETILSQIEEESNRMSIVLHGGSADVRKSRARTSTQMPRIVRRPKDLSGKTSAGNALDDETEEQTKEVERADPTETSTNSKSPVTAPAKLEGLKLSGKGSFEKLRPPNGSGTSGKKGIDGRGTLRAFRPSSIDESSLPPAPTKSSNQKKKDKAEAKSKPKKEAAAAETDSVSIDEDSYEDDLPPPANYYSSDDAGIIDEDGISTLSFSDVRFSTNDDIDPFPNNDDKGPPPAIPAPF